MAPVLEIEPPAVHKNGTSNKQQKNQAARQLLKQWLADTSGYDEQNWPEVKRTLEENRLSMRKRFDD